MSRTSSLAVSDGTVHPTGLSVVGGEVESIRPAIGVFDADYRGHPLTVRLNLWTPDQWDRMTEFERPAGAILVGDRWALNQVVLG